MYQFSIIKHHAFLGIYKWEYMKRFLLRLPFFLDFSLLPHFLKAMYAKFSGRGVLLGECQLHKILSLLILQVQFDCDSSVLLGKCDLPNI